MVLGKLPVLGRSTNLVNSRARACSRCGCGLIGLCLRSLSLWETRYRLKHCRKGPLNP